MIANLILAAFAAALAHWAGANDGLTGFVLFATFRLEVMASTFSHLTHAVHVGAEIDGERLRREIAMYEGAIAQVAANN